MKEKFRRGMQFPLSRHRDTEGCLLLVAVDRVFRNSADVSLGLLRKASDWFHRVNS